MPRTTLSKTQLAGLNQVLASLQADQAKTQELLEAALEQLNDPGSQIRPLLEQQTQLDQKLKLLAKEMEIVQGRIAYLQTVVDAEDAAQLHRSRTDQVNEARAIIPDWAEQIAAQSKVMEELLRNFYAATKAGNSAMLALELEAKQTEQSNCKSLLWFENVKLPVVERAGVPWVEWSMTMRPVDLDPEATQLALAQRQAEQEAQTAKEDARQAARIAREEAREAAIGPPAHSVKFVL